MQMYVTKNKQQLGPFEEVKVREMLAAGELSQTDLGIRQGEQNWQPLGNLFPADSIASAIPNPISEDSAPTKKGGGCLRLFGIALILLAVVSLIGGLVNYGMRSFNDYSCKQVDSAKLKLDEAFNKLSSEAKNVPINSPIDQARLSSEDRALLKDYEDKSKIYAIYLDSCIDLREVKRYWIAVTIGISVVSLLIGIIGLVIVFTTRKKSKA